MKKETTEIKRFLTRIWNSDNTVPFAWINTRYKKLSEQGRKDLQKYIEDKGFIRMLIIVDNIEITRPQRTWGDMPEWFRPASEWHSFNNCDIDNTFIFAIYKSDYGNDIKDEEIDYALNSFPEKSTIYLLEQEL